MSHRSTSLKRSRDFIILRPKTEIINGTLLKHSILISWLLILDHVWFHGCLLSKNDFIYLVARCTSFNVPGQWRKWIEYHSIERTWFLKKLTRTGSWFKWNHKVFPVLQPQTFFPVQNVAQKRPFTDVLAVPVFRSGPVRKSGCGSEWKTLDDFGRLLTTFGTTNSVVILGSIASRLEIFKSHFKSRRETVIWKQRSAKLSPDPQLSSSSFIILLGALYHWINVPLCYHPHYHYR